VYCGFSGRDPAQSSSTHQPQFSFATLTPLPSRPNIVPTMPSLRSALILSAQLFCRYVAALVLLFAVAALVICFGAISLDTETTELLSPTRPANSSLEFFVDCAAAAIGMFLATFCLPRKSRAIGGTILLFMGLAYYWAFWWVLWSEINPMAHHGHGWMVPPFALGGLGSLWTVALISRRPNVSESLSSSQRLAKPFNPDHTQSDAQTSRGKSDRQATNDGT
jgi:hypothetical protein